MELLINPYLTSSEVNLSKKAHKSDQQQILFGSNTKRRICKIADQIYAKHYYKATGLIQHYFKYTTIGWVSFQDELQSVYRHKDKQTNSTHTCIRTHSSCFNLNYFVSCWGMSQPQTGPSSRMHPRFFGAQDCLKIMRFVHPHSTERCLNVYCPYHVPLVNCMDTSW